MELVNVNAIVTTKYLKDNTVQLFVRHQYSYSIAMNKMEILRNVSAALCVKKSMEPCGCLTSPKCTDRNITGVEKLLASPCHPLAAGKYPT